MNSRALFWSGIGLVVAVGVAALLVFLSMERKANDAFVEDLPKALDKQEHLALLELDGEAGDSNEQQSTPQESLPKQPEEPFELTATVDDFEALLLAINADDIRTRSEAWKVIDGLSKREKIHWLGIFAKSDEEILRLLAMRVVRMCFGTEEFQRKAKMTYKDVKARQDAVDGSGAGTEGNAVIQVDMSSLPTKYEAVKINNIVRGALRDESPEVRKEAVLTASSFDIDTCHTIYQYAMTSCSDDVRIAILSDAAYGDEDYLLRLRMAALDVGGEEVVKIASEGVEKTTGQQFTSTSEAFEWYEENRTNDDELELVVGNPEEEGGR